MFVPAIAMWLPTTLSEQARVERMAPSSAEDAATETENAGSANSLEEEYKADAPPPAKDPLDEEYKGDRMPAESAGKK